MNPTTTVVTEEPVSGAPEVVQVATSRATSPEMARLVSLDVFRGITIAGMLLVNNPGSWGHIYPPLEHATWNGWTPTDLIFPFFVFIVGVAMTFSFGKLLEIGADRNRLLLKTAKRAALIFLVGLAIHSFPWVGYDYSHWRIPGVLQRIAIAYFFAATIYLFTTTRGQILAIAALLLGYWALQTLVPVPGGFTGVLQPGQDLGAYIDRAVFTTDHLWREAKTWDPEGLLSDLPTIATCLIGGLAGTWIRARRDDREKVIGLFAAGAVLMALGGMWGWVFPINKSLWTSSYVLFTGGFACQFLALIYFVVDMKGHARWTKPFVIYGTNSIAVFFLSAALARTLNLVKLNTADGPVALKTFIYKTYYESWLQPINASLLFAITYVLFFLAVLTVMYRRKIFIKL